MARAGDDLAPRVAALNDLLREVDGLRLVLATDLVVAAAAAQAGEVEIAGTVLAADRREVRAFEHRALRRLEELGRQERQAPPVLPAPPPAHRGRRRALRALPRAGTLAAAAGLAAVLALVPGAVGHSGRVGPGAASPNGLAELASLSAAGAPEAQVRAAALRLHAQLARMVQASREDPDTARRALLVLMREQQVLGSTGDTAALRAVLAQSQALAEQLRTVLAQAARGVTTPSLPPTAAAPGVATPSPRLLPSPTGTVAPAASPAPSSSSWARVSTSSSPHPAPSAEPLRTGDPSPSATPGLLGGSTTQWAGPTTTPAP